VLCNVSTGARRPSDHQLSNGVRQMTSTFIAVAVGADVTAAAAQSTAHARRSPAHKPWTRLLRNRRARLDSTDDVEAPQTAATVTEARSKQRHDETAVHQSGHRPPHVTGDPLHSPPITTTATRPAASGPVRPNTLGLQPALSQPARPPTADRPQVGCSTSCTAADVINARRATEPGGGGQGKLGTAPAGHFKLKISDVPGKKARAEPVKGRYRTDSPAAAAGCIQTPDSGVAVSPLDQHPAGVQTPDAQVLQYGTAGSASGPEYRIAQTPTKSTIVIIRNDTPSLMRGAGSRANTPSTSSPVRDDQTSIPVLSGLPQSTVPVLPGLVPHTATATTTATATAAVSRQPVINVSTTAATSKFTTTDTKTTTTTAGTLLPAGNPAFRSFPSTSSDERTVVRLHGAEGEPRRYIISADTLTAVEPVAAAKLLPRRPIDSGQTASKSVDPKPAKASGGPSSSRPRNDVELNVRSKKKAILPPPAQKRAPAGDRSTTSSKTKASTPKQRQPSVHKQTPPNVKAAQRSKQSQIVKQLENRLPAPAKLTQNGKQQDSGLAQTTSEDTRPAKSFSELRAMFQTPAP